MILELLWSKEVETRRHAGRMLRALASHDAGKINFHSFTLVNIVHHFPETQFRPENSVIDHWEGNYSNCKK